LNNGNPNKDEMRNGLFRKLNRQSHGGENFLVALKINTHTIFLWEGKKRKIPRTKKKKLFEKAWLTR